MTTDAPTMIEALNLEFAYPNSDPVLSIAELQIKAGDRVFIHGPSGSGKTTLLGLLAGVLQPASGSCLTVLGADFMQLSSAQRDVFRGEHIGYIFQMFNLIPYLNVLENITLPCRLNRARRKRALSFDHAANNLSDLAKHQAERLSIADLLDKPVMDLSVGQRQRVAAARAFLGRPEIIIADEPTSALDIDRRQEFLELLFENAEDTNACILFVSHDPFLKENFDRQLDLNTLNRATTTGSTQSQEIR